MAQYIEINSKIMMGKLVIRRTRITVESLLKKLYAVESEENTLESHPHITSASIKAALVFALLLN